jgi:hypothetical protein
MPRRRGPPTVAGMTDTALDPGRIRRVGETFIDALTARDFTRLLALIADDVRFRLLVPRGPQATLGAGETLSRFVGWFGGADELRPVSSHVDTVAGRLMMTYRLRLRDVDGWRLIEQHLIANLAPDGRIAAIDLLCSGFHPEANSLTV